MLDATAPAHWDRRQQIACHLSGPSGDFRNASSVDYRALLSLAESVVVGWGNPIAGSRIPVYCNNSFQTMAALVACLRSDLVLVQADPVWFERYSDLISDTRNSIPDTRNFLSVDLAAILETRREELAGGRYGETLAWLATIAFAAPSSSERGHSSAGTSADSASADSASADSAKVDPLCTDGRDKNRHDFLIGFTSGSSGVPKAFVRTRQSWIESFRCAALAFGSCAEKTTLIPGPLSHGLSFFAMAESLDAGGTVYLQQRFNASYCLELMQTITLDRLVVVPTMLTKIISDATSDNACRGPRRIICAGDKLSPMLLKDVQNLWPDTIVSEYYGASELSFVSVRHDAKHLPMQSPPISVGAAFDGVEITIVPMAQTATDTASTTPDTHDNPDSDTVVSAEEAGQIFIASELLARGYLDSDGQRIVPLQGAYRQGQFAATVGDVGWLDDQGFLYLIDRASNMIISGGLNLYPAIVERAIERLESVQSCQVLGVEDVMWGQRVVAVIKLNTDHRSPRSTADLAISDTRKPTVDEPETEIPDTRKISLQTKPVEMPDTLKKSSINLDTRKFSLAITEPPYKLLKEKLHNHAMAQLEPHQRPKRYFLIDEWPLNRSLKIDRAMLQQWLHTGHRAITAL